MRPNQGSLHFELTFMTTNLRPNSLEILVAITVIQRTEGHASTLTARFINLPTEPYGGVSAASLTPSVFGSTGAMTLRIKKMAKIEETMKENPTHGER